jgi:hypothetical protein
LAIHFAGRLHGTAGTLAKRRLKVKRVGADPLR